MIVIRFRSRGAGEGSQFGAADEDVRLAGRGVEIDEFAAIEIGEMFPVGRPCEALWRLTGQRAVAKDSVHRKRLGRERFRRRLGGSVTRYQPKHECCRKNKCGRPIQCCILRKLEPEPRPMARLI